MTMIDSAGQAVEVFHFPATGQEIRTVIRDGDPWFVAADAAAVLDLGNPRSSLALLDDDERGVHGVDTPGGQQSLTVVSEAGLYSLILRSRKSAAKAFKRWITHDVLPAIRRTGRYEVEPQHRIPQTFAQALELAARQAREIEEANQALAIAEPKAEAWDVLASADGDYSVREAAYILNRDPAIDTGQTRLFATLREYGLIDKRDTPYATHASHVHLRATSYEHPATGERVASSQVRVTAAGVRYLHRRMGGVRQPAFADLLREVSA